MSKLVESSSLKFLDVITSDRFVFGRQRSSIYEPEPIEVGFESPWQFEASTDPTRSNARFVVLAVRTEGNTEGHGGPYDTWRQVTAKRLNEDDTYNPKGEVISFPISGMRHDQVIQEVTLVGRMQLVISRSE